MPQVTKQDVEQAKEARMKIGSDLLALRDKHKETQGDWPAEDNQAFARMSGEYDKAKTHEDKLAEDYRRDSAIAEREARFGRIESDSRDNREPGRDDYSGRDRDERNDENSPQSRGRDTLDAIQGWLRHRLADGPNERQRNAARRIGFNLGAAEIDIRLAPTEAYLHRDGGFVCSGANQVARLNRRNLTVGTGDAGGYLVPEEFMLSLEESMLTIGGPRSVSQVIRTATGASLKWPGVDDTSNTGEQLDEGASVVENADSVDPTFSQKTWGAYKFSSKPVRVSYELLRDAPFNLAGYIAMALGERLGRITTSKYTTGSGSDTPQGVTAGISAGVTAAATNAITGDQILALTHAIDPAYRVGPKVCFMMHDNIVLKVRQLKDGQSNYLWTMGALAGVPDRLAGYPLTINQYMASSLTAAAKAMIFGNFDKYGIRDVGTIRLRRLDELYAETDEVGFVGFLSSDAKWINTAAAKTLVMAAS